MYMNKVIHITMICTKSVDGSARSLLLVSRGIVHNTHVSLPACQSHLRNFVAQIGKAVNANRHVSTELSL